MMQISTIMQLKGKGTAPVVNTQIINIHSKDQ